MIENSLANEIMVAANEVHSILGPGFSDSIYEICLAIKLTNRHLCFERQKSMSVAEGQYAELMPLKLDFLVENKVIVKVKAVEELLPVHTLELITCQKLTRCKVALLFNFNEPVLQNGTKCIVNGYRWF